MSAWARLGLFGLGLVVIFSAAVGVGSLVEPTDTETETANAEGGSHEVEGTMDGSADHQEMSEAPAGLAVSEGGLSMRPRATFLRRGETGELSFRIVGASGEAVRRFDELHERRMHLIVVRRDGTGFRHLHPEMDGAGTWTTAIRFEEAGVHRAFADFSVGGEQHTLAVDLFVSGGDFEARPLPAPASTGSTDGYEVDLETEGLAAGGPTSLNFSVSQDGRAVDDLEPYLGARGHLVALREGDLAYLHVHPEAVEDAHDVEGTHDHGGSTGGRAGDGIAFAATFPTAGRYRLYLQFRHEGSVRTVEFTVEVER
jgi:hypothetical protein